MHITVQLVEIRFLADTPPVWTTCDLRCFSPNVPMSLTASYSPRAAL